MGSIEKRQVSRSNEQKKVETTKLIGTGIGSHNKIIVFELERSVGPFADGQGLIVMFDPGKSHSVRISFSSPFPSLYLDPSNNFV